ncbi:MAG: hypothetical protein ACTHU0_23440 [Kofleriaceae bacterium]
MQSRVGCAALIFAASACSSEGGARDAPPPTDAVADDAAPDAPDDAPPDAACTAVLLSGDRDPTEEGWMVTTQGAALLSLVPDGLQIETTTNPGESTSGMLLLYLPDAVPPPPFGFEVELAVDRVDMHNQFDAAVAILGAASPFPAGVLRNQMIYVDRGAVGWADDRESAPADSSGFHTYRFVVDAANTATLSIDGAPKLTRANFEANQTIAIGDQTNDPRFDAKMRIRAIRRVCP